MMEGIGSNGIFSHRIWAFSQEADDTQVVNHLKRLHVEKANEFGGTKFYSGGTEKFLCDWEHNVTVITWHSRQNKGDQRTCCVLGARGRSVSCVSWVSSPRLPSEQLPVGHTDPPSTLSFPSSKQLCQKKWTGSIKAPALQFVCNSIFGAADVHT